jgi:hypothetical protein
VKLAEIVEVSRYSKGYASYIRSGKWTPHVSTWPALARLVGLDLAELASTPDTRPERVSVAKRAPRNGPAPRPERTSAQGDGRPIRHAMLRAAGQPEGPSALAGAPVIGYPSTGREV